jgi:hypothetical protein
MNPLLKKLLLLLVVIYLISSCWTQVRLIERVGELEHKMFHLLGGTDGH